MAPVNLIVSALLTATALLLIGLAIPLIRGAIPMNRWYGVRFRPSFTSPEAWYAINRYGAWQAVAWSLPLLVLGGIALRVPLEGQLLAVLMLLLSPAVAALIAAYVTYRYARRFEAE